MNNHLPPPPAICELCLQNGHESPNGNVVAVYCQHHQAGGVYVRHISAWRIYGPISRETFARSLVMAEQDENGNKNDKMH